ncbi:predicted protein [Botrytis cinerea T4]|uniref:Uncharacterized protein n=1 Tax=Botryotinia fuckeliana (strain T4) TaxID=999810 RepID=G2YFG5_BOTF4|nr:predicted protein [Botrytis cinerea T4]
MTVPNCPLFGPIERAPITMAWVEALHRPLYHGDMFGEVCKGFGGYMGDIV